MGAGPPLTQEEIVTILERIPEGMTLLQSCKKSKRGYANVIKRISESAELKNMHAGVREEYVRNRVQEMHAIAKNGRIEPARARIMIDVIKWEAARVLPKEFGDRVQQEVIITNNTTLSDRMAKARARAQQHAVAVMPAPKPSDDGADDDERA